MADLAEYLEMASSLLLPPTDQRHAVATPTTATDFAVNLLESHTVVRSALTRRSPADFRPLPTAVTELKSAVAAAFAPSSDAPPSLVAELALLLTPRLERLVHHLRHRLARNRKELPLPAIREMDPACLRKVARRSGTTLTEKAGPRQKLPGVVRVSTHDTMENRVIVAVCIRLLDLAKRQIALVRSANPDLVGPRALGLKRLMRAAQSVLGRPELGDVGLPRAGERPSNALLGDADYRAVWRAWQLLRREDDDFRQRWLHQDRLWAEVVMAAAWAHCDAMPDFEPMPAWVRVQADGASGLWLQCSTHRSWVRTSQSLAEIIRVELVGAEVQIAHILATDGSGQVVVRKHVSTARPASPDQRWLAMASAAVADCLPPRFNQSLGASSESAPQHVGISALNASLFVHDGLQVRNVGPTAAAELEVPGETHLFVGGRVASWHPACAGPRALMHEKAQLGGKLLANHAGSLETAVVVQDVANEWTLSQLRQNLGRCWAVWSPVAAALAAAERYGAVFDAELGHSDCILVVVSTDAACDIAVLEQQFDSQDESLDRSQRRLWVRSEPLMGSAEGAELRRFGQSHTSIGAWLRAPNAYCGWYFDGELLRSSQFPLATPVAVPDILARLSQWRGKAPALCLCVGVSAAGREVLARQFRVLELEEAALATGAGVFLRRRAQRLPTWKDRLPEVSLQVREGRIRKPIPLIPRGLLVAPGQRILSTSATIVQIPAGESHVDFDMQREGRSAPYRLRIEGHPLPLREPCDVRVELDYEYGVDGLSGHVLADQAGQFERKAFQLSLVGQTGETSTVLAAAPPLRDWLAVPDPKVVEIRHAFAGVESMWKAMPHNDRKKASKQGGVADAQLEPLLKSLADALKGLQGQAPLPTEPIRQVLEMQVIPWLDWILGVGKPDGRGDRPNMSAKNQAAALRARASTGLRASSTLFQLLVGDHGRPITAEALQAVGKLVAGDENHWRTLVRLPPAQSPSPPGWAKAVTAALSAVPELAAQDIELTRLVLATCVQELAAMVDDGRALAPKNKDQVYDLLAPIPWLCFARSAGLLMPADADVVCAIQLLENIRAALPEGVRQHGRGSAMVQDDEPIQVAIDYLRGEYKRPPATRAS